jgi:hypothetical protein
LDLGPDAAAEALAKLPYTRAVVSEALRLTASATSRYRAEPW